ncbi:hypothetical protein BDV97DRAFT_413462 [Delphinella strobiligena]|nr:hypothetical protein BDV97DRAFT_413462 [Delphinella strobiligena]
MNAEKTFAKDDSADDSSEFREFENDSEDIGDIKINQFRGSVEEHSSLEPLDLRTGETALDHYQRTTCGPCRRGKCPFWVAYLSHGAPHLSLKTRKRVIRGEPANTCVLALQSIVNMILFLDSAGPPTLSLPNEEITSLSPIFRGAFLKECSACGKARGPNIQGPPPEPLAVVTRRAHGMRSSWRSFKRRLSSLKRAVYKKRGSDQE